jgi:hypothetical protein
VYIDDLLIMGDNEDDFVYNVTRVLQWLRDHKMTLNPTKLKLGCTEVEFVGHVIDSDGINMSQKRIDNTINIRLPENLKELHGFLGVANYFRDHIKNHSFVTRPLVDMVNSANRIKSKFITWTDIGKQAFSHVKDLINACPKLYFIDYQAEIILCTDASDYALGAYLFQNIIRDGATIEQPIRFLSKSFTGPQLRWSTIEKEAFAVYYALLKFEDLLGGVRFTIRTDHNNLLYLNNAGSRKVLNWKLSIQHFDCVWEHIKGPNNIVADHFSRQVDKPDPLSVHVLAPALCSPHQTQLIQQGHEYQFAHWGVNKTIDLLIKLFPDDVTLDRWPHFRRDVRDFIRRCPTCQKMSPLQGVIRANPYTLVSYIPFFRIAMDTIGPLPPSSEGHKYIIVIIDTFTRYVELFPAVDVSAQSAASALVSHILRFGVPSELVTDNGSQFVNQVFQHIATHVGFSHFTSIPYSKEENGLVERANKEINRHIRNIMFDNIIQTSWSEHLDLTANLLNSTVKEPLGTSPHQLVFGRDFDILPQDLLISSVPHNTIRGYLDDLISRQQRILTAAQRSQMSLDEQHKNRRRSRRLSKTSSLLCSSTTSTSFAVRWTLIDDVWTRSPASTWSPTSRIISEDDISITQFKVGDYVLRKHPPSFTRAGNPHKYGSYWRGPFLVTHRNLNPLSGRYIYTLLNLVSKTEHDADISQLKPFYYDPSFVNPLNIAVKDSEEFIVGDIIDHQLSDDGSSLWRVHWEGYGSDEDTWEPWHNIKDVDKFHLYCFDKKLYQFLPSYVPHPSQ